MEEQKTIFREVQEMIEPTEKTEAEISQEFLAEFNQLVKKYKRNFMISNGVQIVKADIIETPKQ